MRSATFLILSTIAKAAAGQPTTRTVTKYGSCGGNSGECQEGLLCEQGSCMADKGRTCKFYQESCEARTECCGGADGVNHCGEDYTCTTGPEPEGFTFSPTAAPLDDPEPEGFTFSPTAAPLDDDVIYPGAKQSNDGTVPLWKPCRRQSECQQGLKCEGDSNWASCVPDTNATCGAEWSRNCQSNDINSNTCCQGQDLVCHYESAEHTVCRKRDSVAQLKQNNTFLHDDNDKGRYENEVPGEGSMSKWEQCGNDDSQCEGNLVCVGSDHFYQCADAGTGVSGSTITPNSVQINDRCYDASHCAQGLKCAGLDNNWGQCVQDPDATCGQEWSTKCSTNTDCCTGQDLVCVVRLWDKTCRKMSSVEKLNVTDGTYLSGGSAGNLPANGTLDRFDQCWGDERDHQCKEGLMCDQTISGTVDGWRQCLLDPLRTCNHVGTRCATAGHCCGSNTICAGTTKHWLTCQTRDIGCMEEGYEGDLVYDRICNRCINITDSDSVGNGGVGNGGGSVVHFKQSNFFETELQYITTQPFYTRSDGEMFQITYSTDGMSLEISTSSYEELCSYDKSNPTYEDSLATLLLKSSMCQFEILLSVTTTPRSTSFKLTLIESTTPVTVAFGIRDDYLGTTDEPLKELGSFDGQVFQRSQRSCDVTKALKISTADETLYWMVSGGDTSGLYTLQGFFRPFLLPRRACSDPYIDTDGQYWAEFLLSPNNPEGDLSQAVQAQGEQLC